jgi:uracil-DNA glycosylase family 4
MRYGIGNRTSEEGHKETRVARKQTKAGEEPGTLEEAEVLQEEPVTQGQEQAEPQAPAPTEAESKAARLAAVAERASVCVACDLAKTRANVVFGEGNPNAPLMLIGEGPGQNEDATGRPFVGRAGVLLDQCLRENGITRKHIYICNIVRCRPVLIEAGQYRNRPPTPEEQNACFPWLMQTIEIVQPLVILCLGATPANVIIRRGFRIMQERGQWFESRFARYAMAALHPAYILRQQGEAYDASRRSLVEDIAAARLKVIEAKREPKMTLF